MIKINSDGIISIHSDTNYGDPNNYPNDLQYQMFIRNYNGVKSESEIIPTLKKQLISNTKYRQDFYIQVLDTAWYTHKESEIQRLVLEHARLTGMEYKVTLQRSYINFAGKITNFNLFDPWVERQR